MNKRNSKNAVALISVLLFAGALSAQRTFDQQLVLNGKATSAALLQMNGHSYVDVEALAQITNGSVRIEPNQVVWTIPNTNFDVNTPQPSLAMTKDFASVAFATLAEMKEWRGALGAMVKFGLAVDGSWARIYHERRRH